MQLSERTAAILKNMATINPSLIFKPGKEIKTMATARNVFCQATIDTDIPSKACVYDLPRFLGALSLYNKPDIDFTADSFIIKEGKRTTRYTYADESMIVNDSDKTVNITSPLLEVDVSWDDLSSVMKAAAVLGMPDITMVAADGVCKLMAANLETPSSDTYSVEIGATDQEFVAAFLPETLKLLQNDYTLVMAKGICQFKSPDVTYAITTVKDKSKF